MEIVTDSASVDRYQRVFKKNFVRSASGYQRTVQAARLTYECRVYWDRRNRVWAHFGMSGNRTHYWNPFGSDNPEEPGHSKYVTNIVQLNPSRVGHFNTGGAFVRDVESEAVFIAHSGRIGGESVGSGEEFLRAFDAVLIKAGKTEKAYTIVADLEDPRLNERIAAFVESCAIFKGKKSTAGPSRKPTPLTSDEYAGKIQYHRAGYVATVRLHGRVYVALKRELTKLGVTGLRRDVNRDLFLERDGKYVLFEIKTGAAPYDIYTAVGQLMLHGLGPKGRCSRILVVPSVPQTYVEKLQALGISTITYRDGGKPISFVGISNARKACGF